MFLLSKVLPLLLLPLGEAHSAFQMARAKRLFERQGLRVLLNWIPSAKGLDSTSRTLYRAW